MRELDFLTSFGASSNIHNLSQLRSWKAFDHGSELFFCISSDIKRFMLASDELLPRHELRKAKTIIKDHNIGGRTWLSLVLSPSYKYGSDVLYIL